MVIRKIFAVTLFFYAAVQILTAFSYGKEIAIAQLIFAILAILVGVYFWKRSKEQKQAQK